MATSLTVTEAARNFSDVVNKVFYRGESMELTRGGKVVARLIPASEAEAPTGREVSKAWKIIPHLSPKEADAFAEDLESGRASLNQIPVSRWD
jgi:prevent-host-death family protein